MREKVESVLRRMRPKLGTSIVLEQAKKESHYKCKDGTRDCYC